jgi:hypothetical protein
VQHADPDRRSFALIGFQVDGSQKGNGQPPDKLLGLVRAAVVDEKDFIAPEVGVTKSTKSREALSNAFFLVVPGNDDGDEIRHLGHKSRNRKKRYHESTKAGKREKLV